MRAKFTQRHHEIIATLISQAVARVQYTAETVALRLLVDDFCHMFQNDNLNFVTNRFLRQCSLPHQPSDPVALTPLDGGPWPDTVPIGTVPTPWLPTPVPNTHIVVDTFHSDLAAIRRASEQDLAHLFEDDVIEDDGASDAD